MAFRKTEAGETYFVKLRYSTSEQNVLELQRVKLAKRGLKEDGCLSMKLVLGENFYRFQVEKREP